jgi:ABC-type multidrug transport system fused ATPase/permease subunit
MRNAENSNLTIIKRFVPFTRPYLKKYALAILLLIITSLLALLPPFLLKIIIDDAIKNGQARLLNLITLAMAAAIIAAGTSRGVMEYIHEWVSARFIFDLRRYLFNLIQSQSMDFFSSVKVGDILGRLRVDITAVYGVLVNTLLGAISEAVQIIGIAVLLFYLDVRLALIAIVFIPPLYIVLTYTGKRLRQLSRVTRDQDVALLEFFQERIANIGVIKIFHREQHEDRSHKKLSEDFIQATLVRVRYKFISMFLIGTLTSLASVVVIWYGGHQVIKGALSFGSLIAFYLYVVRLYTPIQSLANRGIEVYNGMASADRLIEYMDLKPTVREPERPVRLRNVLGRISFDKVSFTYPNSADPVINDLTLEIPAGQKVALVGSSGAGKTTLVNLLSRLYEVTSGSISIDGHDIRELAFDCLYDSLGVVSQDTFLFNSTIEENIRFGRVDATHEEVVEAAKKAHLHEFILSLPAGYSTIVGARGMKLSGGQRQRLAIARMVLKDAKIWILDEFTSSLDSSSENVVYQNLEPLLQNRTTLIIAHRFSTILSADRVVVIHDGNIIEAGTHADLYRLDGVYRKLFDTQFRHNKVFMDIDQIHDSLTTAGAPSA